MNLVNHFCHEVYNAYWFNEVPKTSNSEETCLPLLTQEITENFLTMKSSLFILIFSCFKKYQLLSHKYILKMFLQNGLCLKDIF